MNNLIKNTLLLEEIYNRPELLEVDKLFAEILKVLPSKEFKEPIIERNFSKIEKIINKLFNIDCKIFLNLSLNDEITFCMQILPSYEELKGQFLDAIEEEGKGFKLISCHNVSIEIESSFLNFIKKKGYGNEKYLTAVLLHEIGHKVFVRVQNQAYHNEERSKKKLLWLKLSPIATLIPLAIRRSLFWFNMAWIITALVIYGSSSLKDFIETKFYSKREAYSDSLAIKYGYGKEMYEILTLLQEEVGMNHYPSFLKFIDKFKKNLNYFYLRRKAIISELKKEYDKASGKQKEIIGNILRDLIKLQNVYFDEKEEF